MKKYEVRTFTVETKDGKQPVKVFLSQVNQDTTLLKSFDKYDDARAELEKFIPHVRELCNARPYFEHGCAIIEENEYAADGDWVRGGDWLYIISREI